MTDDLPLPCCPHCRVEDGQRHLDSCEWVGIYCYIENWDALEAARETREAALPKDAAASSEKSDDETITDTMKRAGFAYGVLDGGDLRMFVGTVHDGRALIAGLQAARADVERNAARWKHVELHGWPEYRQQIRPVELPGYWFYGEDDDETPKFDTPAGAVDAAIAHAFVNKTGHA